MSDKTFGRVVIAVCLVVLLLLALTSCAAVPPKKKSAIPGDLVLARANPRFHFVTVPSAQLAAETVRSREVGFVADAFRHLPLAQFQPVGDFVGGYEFHHSTFGPFGSGAQWVTSTE